MIDFTDRSQSSPTGRGPVGCMRWLAGAVPGDRHDLAARARGRPDPASGPGHARSKARRRAVASRLGGARRGSRGLAVNASAADAVVSNAGIFNSIPFDELSADDWRKMLSVHLDGGFYLSQPAYRVMKRQGYGRFVFISSSGGMFGQPLEAHYAAAKAGLVGLTNVIAIEGAEHGILANTVLPFGFSRMVTETVGPALEKLLLSVIKPELVVPMIIFLSLLRSATRTARLRRSLRAGLRRTRPGWLADAANPTADDIAVHLDEVSATEPFTVPGSIFEEVFAVAAQLGVGTG